MMLSGFLRLILVVTCLLVQVSAVPKNVFRDKTGLCKRYGMACPVDKTCMVQQIDWPRRMRLPVCVGEKFAPAHLKACYQPPERGPCAAEFIRWHYNVQANQCSWFYFGGCEGNRNNFFSKDACERACLGDVKSDKTDTGSIKKSPKSAAEVRAEEFWSRPKPAYRALQSHIETVVSKNTGSKQKRKGKRRHESNRTYRGYRNRADNQWPNSYRKTLRRGELFQLFSTLNRGRHPNLIKTTRLG